MRIQWLPRALVDLEQVGDYLRMQAPEVESRIVLQIYDSIGSLAEMPLRGRPMNRNGVRQLLLIDIQYVITYRVLASSVQILRIRHGARKPLKD